MHLTITEYQKIPREQIGATRLQRLERLDRSHAAGSGEHIFDWSAMDTIRALNHVGVVQVPGLTVEILPKIEQVNDMTNDGEIPPQRARHNLLYMLAVTRCLPIRERHLAALRVQRMSLLEALIAIFARALVDELRRGLHHDYVRREENGHRLKGKLLLTQHLRANVARRDRMWVAFDEFLPDNLINRILKATCMRLVSLTRVTRTRQLLQEALIEMEQVDAQRIDNHHFEQVHLSRNSQRFEHLVDFCRLVLSNRSPAPTAGELSSFTLLFAMDQLFEEFVGRMIRRHADSLGFDRRQVRLQAHGDRRWLLRTSTDQGRFRLIPDVVVKGAGRLPQLILDTKWKRLRTDAEDARNGVSQADIYQLFAYAQQYQCPLSILLYPAVSGVSPKCYRIAHDAHERQIKIAFIDLSVDLAANNGRFVDELQAALA
ncbi:McrC family protein [Phycisphaerales bacterium AB-hyl4]|uniref:McrC family protein n=1 Tax=Natronomicrosphaera hydrolytica TaxID=3242702 RepID=A0ABV4U245_9BACT